MSKNALDEQPYCVPYTTMLLSNLPDNEMRLPTPVFVLCSGCVFVHVCVGVCECVRASVHLNGTVSQRGMP